VDRFFLAGCSRSVHWIGRCCRYLFKHTAGNTAFLPIKRPAWHEQSDAHRAG
jgi:hypothetical protein